VKGSFSFEKNERVASQKLIDELFTGGNSQSVAAFPLRAVYMVRQREDGEPAAKVLVSVAKRRLHHAVDRNRTKRQLREAYRLNKHRLEGALPDDRQLVVAFIWLDDGLHDTAVVAARVKSLLKRIGAKLQNKKS
jgi:ribonuclease P protein component